MNRKISSWRMKMSFGTKTNLNQCLVVMMWWYGGRVHKKHCNDSKSKFCWHLPGTFGPLYIFQTNLVPSCRLEFLSRWTTLSVHLGVIKRSQEGWSRAQISLLPSIRVALEYSLSATYFIDRKDFKLHIFHNLLRHILKPLSFSHAKHSQYFFWKFLLLLRCFRFF